MSVTNLPSDTETGKKEVRQFFNTYFDEQVSFPSNLIDAVVGFFVKRGFDEQVSRSISIVLLNQSRLDDVNVFQLLENLKSLTDMQMNKIITQILNYYRVQTSMLGYKSASRNESFESRNILI